MVINFDEIGVILVLACSRHLAPKGTKDVSSVGKNDRRQSASTSAANVLLKSLVSKSSSKEKLYGACLPTVLMLLLPNQSGLRHTGARNLLLKSWSNLWLSLSLRGVDKVKSMPLLF